MEVYPKKYQDIVESNLKRTGFPTPVCAVLFNTEKVEMVKDLSCHGRPGIFFDGTKDCIRCEGEK